MLSIFRPSLRIDPTVIQTTPLSPRARGSMDIVYPSQSNKAGLLANSHARQTGDASRQTANQHV